MQFIDNQPRAPYLVGHSFAIAFALRCASAVRQRKQVVLGAMAIGLTLGGIYYFATSRIYRAEAWLLPTHEHVGKSIAASGEAAVLEHRLPTYVELFYSTAVVDGALKRIQEMPAEVRIDFDSSARDAWDELLVQNLTVAVRGEAEVIYVACQSRSPDAARLLVEAVVGSFVEFIKRRHKQHTAELLATLQSQRLSIEQPLLQKCKALSEAQQRVAEAARQPETLAADQRISEVPLAELDVARLSAWHESLASQILQLEIQQHHPPVRFDIVSPAVASHRPISPRVGWVFLLALGGSLGVGLSVVFLLDAFDDRFRRPEEVRASVGAPLLASVGQLPVCDGVGLAALQLHAAADSRQSEPFRTLQAALEAAGPCSSSLLVVSPCAGDGKTTVLANLAVAFAQSGKRTLIIDADLRRGAVTKLLNVRGGGGLCSVLAASGDVRELLTQAVRPTGADRLDILPCDSRAASPGAWLYGKRMTQLLAWASENYEQVLIDAPPLTASSDAAALGRIAGGVLLVMQPAVSQRHEVIRAAELLHDFGARLLGVVANRVSDRRDDPFTGLSAYDYYAAPSLATDDPNDAADNPSLRKPCSGQHHSDGAEEIQPRRVA